MIPQPQPPAGPPLQGIDYRTSPRYRVLQRCFVRPPGVRPPDGWRGIVFSLSANGIGVTLPLAVERGTDLEIEAWNLPGAPVLRARVIHVAPMQFVWLTGCELSRRLDADELAAWLSTATADG